MGGSRRGGRSDSLDLAGSARLLYMKLQTMGPRAMARVALVCGFLVTWRWSGALIVPVVFLGAWWLASNMVWAYGLPRWLPWLGRHHRGRRSQLAERGYSCPTFWALTRARRRERKRFRWVRSQMAVVGDVTPKLLGYTGEPVPLEQMRTTLDNDVIARARCGARGVPPRAYLDASEQIKSTVGCRELVVRYIGVDEVELTFLWTERLERELVVAEVPEAPHKAGKRPTSFAYGVRRDGTPALLPMLPVLVSGMTGSGKSSFVWSVFNDLNRQGLRTRLWCSDNKGGAELRSFAGKTGQRLGPNGHLEVAGYATNVEEAGELIQDFYDAMKARLAEQTYRKWTPEVAAEYPLLVLLIDETVELVKLSDREVKNLLLTIVSQIRAAGGMVIALTQLSQKSVLDDLRDMFPIRLSLAQRNAINTNMALGDGAEQMGARCSELTIPADAGRGYSFDEGRKGYEPFRSGWCTDDDVDRRISMGIPIGAPLGQRTPEETRCGVYRLYNAIGELLYVGISNDPAERWRQHANPSSGSDYKPWWSEVAMTGEHRPVVVWKKGADARAQAEAEETWACEHELPRYNDRKNPDSNPLKVRWRDRRRSAAPVPPELEALDFDPEDEQVDVGMALLDFSDTDQPGQEAPEPIEVPDVPVPEGPVETPETTRPEPETPEPRWEQPPEAPETPLPEPERRGLAGSAASGRTRPRRQLHAARKR